MLSALLILTLAATSPPADEPVATTSEASAASRADELAGTVDALHNTPTDVIFADGFETGTHNWSDAQGYSFFSSGPTPSIDLSSCDLRPGTYTLRLDADRLVDGEIDSGHTLEYTMTVVEEPCLIDSGTCLSVSFSDPVETFR